jgi:diguanylate cyclase (GGDEF)-like protein
VDTVARFGGDEFVVLLKELGSKESAAISIANQVAEKFRIALGQPYLLRVVHEGQKPITVEHRCTVSIGVTVFSGDGGKNREDILKQADEAMYHAKHAGRNCVRFYPDIAIT